MAREREQLKLGFDAASGAPRIDEKNLAAQAELAIGEYLARGRRIWPEMPLARVLKALERQGIPPALAPQALELIGARVSRVPEYVAKFNHRITFPQSTLDHCRSAYEERQDD